MKIRLCKQKDVKKVMDVGRDVFSGEPWFKKSILERVIKINPKMCWVLETGNEIAGAQFVHDDFDGRAWGWLSVVAKEHRREGLGTLLFDYACKELKKMKFRKYYSECSVDNKAEIKWLLKNGFRKEGLFKDWYGKNKNAIVFSRDL